MRESDPTDERHWAELARSLAPLPARFYLQPTVEVARKLLGCLLVHDTAGGLTEGRIVETEAYLAEGDAGCHAARGRTERNAPMFERPGTIYVYQIYGMHWCMNLVTQPEGTPEAVLLRAVEPLAGIETMRRRRGRRALKELASGPAKLTQAFDVGPRHNRGDITSGELHIAAAGGLPPSVTVTTRVGLSPGRGDELLLRFLVSGSPWVSRAARRSTKRRRGRINR